MRTVGTIIRIASEQSPITLAKEVAWRAWKQWKKSRFAEQMAERRCPVRFRKIPYYQPNLESVSQASRACIVGIADAVCEGKFPFLSYGTVDLGFPPPWHLDFVSGKGWPLADSERLAVVGLDGSDVKVPWELARLQVLPVLGKAYQLSHQERYRAAAKQLVSDWIERNPVGVGVNWTVAMEVALRSVSFVLLLDLLWPLRADEHSWLEKMTFSLWQHLLFVEAHLEFSHIIRSNHYLSNIVGLFCLSMFLDGEGIEARRRIYRRRIEQEIQHQVYEDGGDCEASTGYHVLVTQLFTTALLLMRAAEIQPSPSFEGRLRRMYQWAAALADARGRLPHAGDCDDGRVELLLDDLEQMLFVPVCQRNSLTISSLLGLGGALFGEAFSGRNEDALWYGLAPANLSHSPARAQDQDCPEVQLFQQSGVAVARRGGVEVLFFAMPNGINGKGSHTHNDKLSLVVRIDGEELLCDSGTGCYTRNADWRNCFRSTAAHNTVMVNHREQNSIPGAKRGAFSLGNEAQVSPINWELSGGIRQLKASHYGYRNLGIEHRRIVRLGAEDQLVVEDCLLGTGRTFIEVHFHLGPQWKVSGMEAEKSQVCCTIEGPRRVRMVISASAEVEASRETTEISTVYGTAVPTEQIRAWVSDVLPFSLQTTLSWGS